MKSHTGLLIAGGAMVAEGIALASFGRRYLDFMAEHGLNDLGKRLMRKANLRSPAVFAAIGLTEAVWGFVLLRRAAA